MSTAQRAPQNALGSRAADLVMAVVLAGLGAVTLALVTLGARLFPVRRSGRRILYLGTGQIAQILPRNGANLFLERECSDFDGYFAEMWNVHFPAGTRGRMDLSSRHHLVDVDVPRLARARRWPRSATLLREIAFLAWLLPFARRHAISVVTGTNPYLQGLNAAIVSRCLSIPFGVIITRDYDWDWRVLHKQAFPSLFPSRAMEKRVERWVLTRADVVLADREYYRRFAVRNGAAEDRAVATRVMADDAFQKAQPDPAIRDRLGLTSGPLLVYVGRLDADKLVLDLADCLAAVRHQFPDAQLVCAGTGSQAPELRDRAEELGVCAAFHLPGAFGLADLASLIASSDVAVAPHLGYTLIEIGLTGTPICTYDYDYHGEVIVDGVTGRLAPFRDSAALATCVCDLLRQPRQAQEMGARLRDQLGDRHSRERVLPLYQQAYERALSRAARVNVQPTGRAS